MSVTACRPVLLEISACNLGPVITHNLSEMYRNLWIVCDTYSPLAGEQSGGTPQHDS